VRIYQVKKEDPLGRDLKDANAFSNGRKLARAKSAPISSSNGKSKKAKRP